MNRILGISLGTVASMAVLASVPVGAAGTERVSQFASYSGYDQKAYSGFVRTSQYVAMPDGTRLAIDLYSPAEHGKAAAGPFPVVWQFTPYNRATHGSDGKVVYPDSTISVEQLTSHGYVVGFADVRGKGVSFGVRRGPGDRQETKDADSLISWLATQPWSSGNVAMAGCSYLGMTTLEGASTGNPHLKAVWVVNTMFDQYANFAKGGIVGRGLADDSYNSNIALPVDEDRSGELARAAWEDQKANTKTGTFFASTPFRDDVNPYTGTRWWIDSSFYSMLSTVNPKLGFYFQGSYFDPFAEATAMTYANVRNPKKMVVGPWRHCESTGVRIDLEQLRFFDYWLKGVQNGVMQGPPIHAWVFEATGGKEIQPLEQWPPQAQRTKYFLHVPETPGSSSQYTYDARDFQPAIYPAVLPVSWHGDLSPQAPVLDKASVTFQTDMAPPPFFNYGVVRNNVDTYSVSFVLPPLGVPTQISGHPVVDLWISAPANDADVYVYLEKIHHTGSAEVISSGELRASHRKLGPPPYDYLGLPFPSQLRADQQLLQPGEPVRLQFALTPLLAKITHRERLRVSITTREPQVKPSAPAPGPITIYADAQHPSSVEIPFVPVYDSTMTN